MTKKIFIYFTLYFFYILNIQARPRATFKIEDDSVLHIRSNFSHEFWDNYDEYDPIFNYSTIVVDEGVDSVSLKLDEKTRLVCIPASLRYLSDYTQENISCDIRINPKNPYLCIEGCGVYDKQKTTLITSGLCKEGSVFNMPATVDSVWNFPRTHFSKIIISSSFKYYPYNLNCDTLVIQSSSINPEWLANIMDNTNYLVCSFDTLVAKMLVEKLWMDEIKWNRNKSHNTNIKEKIFCPGLDVSKRDTSWMSEKYHPIYVTEQGDSLFGIDSISPDKEIQSVIINNIPKSRIRINNDYSKYDFYVTTYDTLYRLPFCLQISHKNFKEDKPKYAEYGEFIDSVFTIREGVDTLPYLADMPSHCRKIIIPKSLHYLKESLHCDSVFIYSDSLEGHSSLKTKYYYVENEQHYLSLKRWNMVNNIKAVVYSPNADIRKRNLKLQENTNPPVFMYNHNGNITNLPIRSTAPLFNTCIKSTIDGISPSDLYIFAQLGRCHNSWTVLPTPCPYIDLKFAVWTYDTLLTLPQKSHITFTKQDGSIWTETIAEDGYCFYYVPKGETPESLMKSGKKIMIFKDGDTIPQRYINRLALGVLYKNGECLPTRQGHITYHLFWRNKRNYIIDEDKKYLRIFIDNAKHPKEIWLSNIMMYNSDCITRCICLMHFYISK
ncbi:MAG: hypothetical protein PUC42_08980 [Bacteroidales bacterium]|nr:hypothetical protein [Bacteroidales bacterium]